MFVSSLVDNVDAFMRKHVYGFIQRLRAIENNLVKCVLSCAYNIPNGMWQRWLTLLYTHSPYTIRGLLLYNWPMYYIYISRFILCMYTFFINSYDLYGFVLK